jgi:hypothetical protein
MMLDSGDDAPITIGRHVAGAVELDPEKKGAQEFNATLVGGVALRGAAYVKDIIFDGNNGSPIISGWIMTMDPGASAPMDRTGEKKELSYFCGVLMHQTTNNRYKAAPKPK